MNKTMTIFAVLALTCVALVSTFPPGARAQQDDADQQRSKDTAQPQMQCPMMAGLKDVALFADSPAVLLSRGKELQLTEEQRQRLQEIEESAREQAHDILTDEQREKLKDAPEGRLSMMELSRMRMKNGGKQQGRRMCPMCMRMMRMRNGQEHGKAQEH